MREYIKPFILATIILVGAFVVGSIAIAKVTHNEHVYEPMVFAQCVSMEALENGVSIIGSVKQWSEVQAALPYTFCKPVRPSPMSQIPEGWTWEAVTDIAYDPDGDCVQGITAGPKGDENAVGYFIMSTHKSQCRDDYKNSHDT
jgi:hypothetical protein